MFKQQYEACQEPRCCHNIRRERYGLELMINAVVMQSQVEIILILAVAV